MNIQHRLYCNNYIYMQYHHLLLCFFFLEMAEYFKYVRQLNFNENPNYNYLRNIFTTALQKHRFVDDQNYDWMVKKKLV